MYLIKVTVIVISYFQITYFSTLFGFLCATHDDGYGIGELQLTSVLFYLAKIEKYAHLFGL